MTVKTVEVAPIGEIPDNRDGGTCRLRISYSKLRDSLDDAEHTPSQQLIIENLHRCFAIHIEMIEQQRNQWK